MILLDSSSTVIASENESTMSCTKLDVEEKFSITDAEDFVIIDQISGMLRCIICKQSFIVCLCL